MDLLQSLLFVPADSPRKLASARSLRPDAFIYDLEDAVAVPKKAEARSLLKDELASLAHLPVKIFVRVNCFGSPFFEEDLRVAIRPQVYGVVLPKCNETVEVTQVQDKILKLEKETGMPEDRVKLVLILESAKAVARAAELARASNRTIALLFGGEDFCADMGIVRTKGGAEIALARSLVALAAKAEGLEAIDGPFTDFHDAAGLFEETQRIKQMGFAGKTLIHPNQIETVHMALASSDEEISFAEEVVKTFEQSGEGVVVVRGKMIDEPVVRQARKVLRLRDKGQLPG